MATVLPRTTLARIVWAEGHVRPFSTNAVAIGITEPIAADFEAKTEAARAAFAARNAAKDVLRDRENDLQIAMTELADLSGAIVNTVHGKADLVGDSVYSLASIPVPSTPGPRPTPGMPTGFGVELQQDGTILVSWECDNSGSSGTQYLIWRRLAGETEFAGMGGTGVKKYLDLTIPAGTPSVTYKIQATRTTGGGAFGEFTVNFGVGGGNGITMFAGKSGKIAA